MNNTINVNALQDYKKVNALDMDELEKLNNQGQTIILITHDINIASRAKRIVRISDGKLYEEESNDKTKEHSKRVNKKYSKQ